VNTEKKTDYGVGKPAKTTSNCTTVSVNIGNGTIGGSYSNTVCRDK
jgi:hypothetical protein